MKVSLLTQIAPENKLLNRLASEVKDAIKAFIAVSFIQQKGLIKLFESLREILNREGKITIFTSGYLRITEPKALSDLLAASKLYNPLLKIFFNPADRFHSKYFLFEKPQNRYSLFLGSSNISAEGLAEIGELNIHIRGYKSDPIYKQISIVMGNLKKDTEFEKLNEDLIESYEEQFGKVSKERKKVKKVTDKGELRTIPALRKYPVYVAICEFTEREEQKIGAKYPKWNDYVSYHGGVRTLKTDQYFLSLTSIKGKKNTFRISRYLTNDKIGGVGRIAHIESGKDLPLSKLEEKFNVFGIKKRDLLNGTKKSLDSIEWMILEKFFKKAFPKG